VSADARDPGLVLLERYASITQAEIVGAWLADAGIDAVLLGETAAGWRPELQTALGVEVRVAPGDLDAATRVLREADAARRERRP
jgi:hypothetical protein